MVTKLSTKGQIVLPVEMRRKYNLAPGSRVELLDVGGEIVVVPLTIDDPISAAQGILHRGKSTREIMRSIRKEEEKFEKQKQGQK
ncbi:MAG: AbrB/MazE/SpoVT family DNA-binding domain-containing protein [Candidatus Margulisiibacteriota bacterium]